MTRSVAKVSIVIALLAAFPPGSARGDAPGCPPGGAPARSGASPFDDDDPDETAPAEEAPGDDGLDGEDEPDQSSFPLDAEEDEEAQA